MKTKKLLATIMICATALMGTGSVGAIDVSNPSDIVVVANNDSFCEVFGNGISAYESNNVGNVATYSYKINFTESDVGRAELKFNLLIGGESYPVEVDGKVFKVPLSEDVLIKGNLYGQTIIHGEEFQVDVGITKLESQDTLSAGVAFTTADYDTNPDAQQILFYFGTPCMTEELWQEYQDQRTKNNVESTKAESDAQAARVSSVGTKYGNFISDNNFSDSGRGQKLVVKLDERGPSILCGLYSYNDSIKASDFKVGTFLEAPVSAFQIGLRKDSGIATISSMTGVKGADRYTSDLGDFWGAAFYDIIGHFGVPTGALSELLGNVGGDVEAVDDGADSYVHVDIAPGDYVDFDDVPFTLEFNIMTNGRNTGVLNAYSYLTYQAELMEASIPIRTKTATLAGIDVGP